MLNILMIGNFLNPSWDGSITDENHIADALDKLGHQTTRLQREMDFKSPETFDFIIIAQWNGYPKHFCKSLKDKYKCPVVYWAFDYAFDSHEDWHFEMAREADLFLSKEMNNRAFYESMGVNFYWLPQDFAPEFLSPYTGNDIDDIEKYDVVFTGSYLPQAEFRNKCLKAVDEKSDLHIFTVTPEGFKDFRNVHPPILDEGLPELYAGAELNLSIDWKVDAEGYWSDRLSQILACGGKVINKYVPMQELIYPNVTHFNTIDECLELVEKRNIIPPPHQIFDAVYVKDRVKQLLEIVKYKLL